MVTEAQREDFFAYLRFPSVSADPGRAPAMAACAGWLQTKLAALGFAAGVHSTGGAPVVLARRSSPGPRKPTLLIYGHYDVQPAEPLELWTSPPFAPTVRNGHVVARGATDNKGQTFAHILGTQAWLRSEGELPVHLIYLIEGEEEIGSPHLGRFLQEHAAELACDGILISDTSMMAPGLPAITAGLRGIACFDFRIRGAAADLHSGVFGGAVPNPAAELCRVLAALHDASGRIAIPGFYDRVAPIAPEESAGWKDLPLTDEAVRHAAAAPALGGEAGWSVVERMWARPTAEINGITAGYQGPGSKTIIPSQASAKLSFRLVPHQDPAEIASLVTAFLAGRTAAGLTAEVNFDHGGEPFLADPNHPLGQAARAALRQVFGREPAIVREGLSIPIVSLLKQILGCDPVLVGLGLPECSAHGPNETFPLAHLELGIAVHQAILREFGA